MNPEQIPSTPPEDADETTKARVFKQREAWRYEHQYKEFMSPHIITGIGREAVRSSIDAATMNTNGQEFLAPGAEAYKQKGLDQARTELDELAANQSEEDDHDSLILLDSVSPWVAKAINLDAHDGNILSALTERTEDGEYAVGDETLLNFLEWHNHALATVQHSFEKEAPALKDRFADTFFGAVNKGWIPQSAEDNLQYLDDVNFIVDDGLRTTAKGIDGATSSPNSRTINIRLNPSKLDDEKLRTHELIHAISGREKSEESHDDVGMKRLFGNGFGGVSMDEAIVEHLASGMLHGKIDEIDPLSEARKTKTYYTERGLLSTLATRGVVPVDIRLFMNAYFENGYGDAQDELQEALNKAFPFIDVVADIGALEKEDDKATQLFNYETKLNDQVYAYMNKEEAARKRTRSVLGRIIKR